LRLPVGYEDAVYHVVGIAPTGRAVRKLAEEAGDRRMDD
jgi:hypothetical protein